MRLPRAARAVRLLLLVLLVSLAGACATPQAGPPWGEATTHPAALADSAPTRPQPVVNANNRLHRHITLPALRCALPAAKRYSRMSAEGQRQFVDAALHCLDEAWKPLLLANELRVLPTPLRLTVVDHTQPAPCSTAAAPDDILEPTNVAVYCNGTVYWPTRDPSNRDWGPVPMDRYMLFVVMHEYSHHLQSLSGIGWQANHRMDAIGRQTPAALEISRRIELQAQCLAGMMIAAAAQGGVLPAYQAQRLVDMQGSVVPSESHGSAANSARWAAAGYRGGSTAACNTWAAPPDAVR